MKTKKNVILIVVVVTVLFTRGVITYTDLISNKTIERAIDENLEHNGGVAPFTGINLFSNTNKLCFFPYCWKRNAKCGGVLTCCWCQCKKNGVFFSRTGGCYAADDINSELSKTGDACLFHTLKLKFSTVPLFQDTSDLNGVRIALSSQETSFGMSHETICQAGKIWYFDDEGIKKLLHNNKCGEKLFVDRETDETLVLRWKSDNAADWVGMSGMLLKMDIHCSRGSNDAAGYSSCLLFQVTGPTSEGLWPTVTDELAENYTCPTVPSLLPTTTISTRNSTDSSLIGGSSVVPPTNGKTDSGNMVSITAGALAAIVVLIATILLLICLLRRRRKQRKADTTCLYTETMPRVAFQPNAYVDQRMIYEKPTDSGKDPEYYDEKACLYVAVDDEPRAKYSNYGEGEAYYEPPDSRMSTLKRSSYDMSKRPLPETPNDTRNPYYEPSSLGTLPRVTNHSNCEERDADNIALYSIYSSIEKFNAT